MCKIFILVPTKLHILSQCLNFREKYHFSYVIPQILILITTSTFTIIDIFLTTSLYLKQVSLLFC